MIASHGIGDAEAALAEAEALGFVARANDRLRLSHAIVRDAIYASLPGAERRCLHLAASRLYEPPARAPRRRITPWPPFRMATPGTQWRWPAARLTSWRAVWRSRRPPRCTAAR